VEVVDPGGIATLVLLHRSSNIADASMKTNHRVLPGFPGMGTGPAVQEIVGPNLTVGWQTLLNQCAGEMGPLSCSCDCTRLTIAIIVARSSEGSAKLNANRRSPKVPEGSRSFRRGYGRCQGERRNIG
jgi:hypothetical protein